MEKNQTEQKLIGLNQFLVRFDSKTKKKIDLIIYFGSKPNRTKNIQHYIKLSQKQIYFYIYFSVSLTSYISLNINSGLYKRYLTTTLHRNEVYENIGRQQDFERMSLGSVAFATLIPIFNLHSKARKIIWFCPFQAIAVLLPYGFRYASLFSGGQTVFIFVFKKYYLFIYFKFNFFIILYQFDN